MNLVNLAYEALEEIKNTKEYQYLIEFKNDIDEPLKKLIANFNSSKEEYLKAKEFGDHYPGLSVIKENLIKAKDELYNNPLVIEYKKNEKIINELLDDLVLKIKDAIIPNKKGSMRSWISWLKENRL